MQVDKIQQSPSFGMMYFTQKGAEAFIEQASPRLNTLINNLGEKVAGTKYFHAAITTDENGCVIPRIVSTIIPKSSLLPPYRAKKPIDNQIGIRARYDGINLGGDYTPANTEFPLTLEYLNAQEAQKAYNEQFGLSEFEAAGEIIKTLDGMDNAKLTQLFKDKIVQAQARVKAQDIISKYAIRNEV